MRIQWNWKLLIIISVSLIILIGTNVLQYFVIWGPKEDRLIASHTQEVQALQSTLDSIGPMVEVWAVKDESQGLFPGKKIEEQDLTAKEIPESLINKSFVLDPVSVIGKYYRIAQRGGSLLSHDLVMDEPLDDTVREYDLVSTIAPVGLKAGDYVDYRIVYPRGEDYIVLPHKRVDAINGQTFKFRMNESEIHIYQAALVDYFIQKKNGATLYLTKYVEPGIQKPATEFYAVPKNIVAIMTADPNVFNKVNAQLNDKARTLIEAGMSSGEQGEYGDISSGRNEVNSKIIGGESQLQSQLKELENKQQSGLPDPQASPKPEPSAAATPKASDSTPPSQIPIPSANPAAGSSDGKPLSNNPLLNVEKGVVE